ncbi:MAG TPA: chemotaxis response regulator protein-glutamate methylesterase [Terracidiphilus sp.]|nr:chemotaxis response regulator protein-glutamate methylesterase [Terracidiphilus sp.]
MSDEPRRRILIVEDSAVMRSLLRLVISSDPRLEVMATAADGASALTFLAGSQPDLVLLDVEMPVMDGLATLRQMRSRGLRIPVIMCSSLTRRGAKVTIDALACGASDYVAKPSGQAGRDAAVQALAQELIPKVLALTVPAPRVPAPVAASPVVQFPVAPQAAVLRTAPAYLNAPSILVIGVSTGGPAALEVLLPALPASFPLPVLIVQHMPELFTRLMAERLNSRCALRVHEASEGEPVARGKIAIARGNWHLELRPPAGASACPTMHLQQGPPENHCRPAVDVLFRSAARTFGSAVLAVVLTGMGSDGLNGARAINQQGGCVLAQDQATSTVWGMPGAVAGAGIAHKIVSLNAMAAEIIRIAGRGLATRTDAPAPANSLKRQAV